MLGISYLGLGEEVGSAVAVGDVGGGDPPYEQQARRVHQDVMLAAVNLLAPVVAPRPAPRALVFTVRLSSTAALG